MNLLGHFCLCHIKVQFAIKVSQTNVLEDTSADDREADGSTMDVVEEENPLERFDYFFPEGSP